MSPNVPITLTTDSPDLHRDLFDRLCASVVFLQVPHVGHVCGDSHSVLAQGMPFIERLGFLP
jgi:hypothetical protein